MWIEKQKKGSNNSNYESFSNMNMKPQSQKSFK